MTRLQTKHPRLRLDRDSHRQLRRSVLQRDQWRCQSCGATAGLEVHHMTSRGRLGDNVEENLITLCRRCHQKIHWNRSP
jgi:5-methylcytosine-specific restriction endonuclease McrA